MKKVRLLLLSLLFALALAVYGSAAGTPVEVLGPQGDYQSQTVRTVSLVLDGVPLKTDVPAFILGGRTLVPVRVVSERLGALVNWKEDTMQVQIENGTKAITLSVGSAEATVNGRTISLPDGVAPTLAKTGGQKSRGSWYAFGPTRRYGPKSCPCRARWCSISPPAYSATATTASYRWTAR